MKKIAAQKLRGLIHKTSSELCSFLKIFTFKPMRSFFFLFLFLLPGLLLSQGTQTIKGTLVELETKATIPGALIELIADTGVVAKANTDDDGMFKFTDVSIGKKSLRIIAFGFPDKVVDVTVTSGK